MSQDLKLADDPIGYAGADHAEQPAWGAVTSLALGVFSLVTAEFLPASLLTPMAATFRVSEALVGQAVTVTAAGRWSPPCSPPWRPAASIAGWC